MNFFRSNKKNQPLAQLLNSTAAEQEFDHTDEFEEVDEYDEDDFEGYDEMEDEEAVAEASQETMSVLDYLKDDKPEASIKPGNVTPFARKEAEAKRTLSNEDLFRSRSTQSSSYATPPASAPKANETVLSGNMTFKGTLEGTQNLTIQGNYSGDINVKGVVTVAEGGTVQGNIRATSVIMSGKVDGLILATERTRLTSTARFTGELFTPRLGMQDGANYSGKISMDMAQGGTRWNDKFGAKPEPAKSQAPKANDASKATQAPKATYAPAQPQKTVIRAEAAKANVAPQKPTAPTSAAKFDTPTKQAESVKRDDKSTPKSAGGKDLIL